MKLPWCPNECDLLSVVADAFIVDDVCEAWTLSDLYGRFVIEGHEIADGYIEHAVERLEQAGILEQQVVETANRMIVLYRLTEPYMESVHPYETWMANMAAKKTSKKTARKTGVERAAMRQVKIEPFRAELLCDLDDDEIKTRGQKLARLQGNIKMAEDEMKSEAKHRKAKIDEMKSSVSKLTAEINEGRALKMVDCERVFSYSTNSVIERRADDHQDITNRPMEQWELQLELPAGAQDDPDDPEPEEG
jgi:uncharacterized protein YnzC (UPF0291/DUF896 family)